MKNIRYRIIGECGLRIGATAAMLALSIFFPSYTTLDAAENAKGIYLLGSNTTLSGIVPPPGTYISNIKYFYSGKAMGAAANCIDLENLGNLSVEAEFGVNADIFIDVPWALTVLPRKILGGHLGIGLLVPIGWQDISADVNALTALTLPDGTRFQAGQSRSFNDDTFNFGDPLATALLGWHEGNWHWNLSGLLNIPIGAYEASSFANMGFNRWAFDARATATWFDQVRGLEVTANVGLTFNGENPDTNYKTGTEFHTEFALKRHFSKSFAFGLVGYHYRQVTGDSGAGATLGDFKGEVTALGPNINYNFVLGKIPVATTLRWLHEFDAKNRMEGDAVIMTATIPLGSRRP